jgi:E3 ubiquitin-protein ligase HUWE1
VPLYQLPAHLSTFPPRWPFPRGDLYHWIPLLNRFDRILELFNQEYGLKDQIQTRSFERQLLVKGDEEPGQVYIHPSGDDLDALGFGREGDRELVEAVLTFSRMLLENCGNRSLYSSSGQLNDILNTTSLSLLNCTLRLGVRLAQRYHASRQRTVGSTSHINSALLLSHYNINLDKIQKLAAPFVKSLPPAEPAQPLSPVAPGKGKEKVTSGGNGALGRVNSVIPVHATDLVALAKGAPAPVSNSTGSEAADGKKPVRTGDAGWDDWGGVWLSYYVNTSSTTGDAKKPAIHGAGIGPAPQLPATPTPSRRNTSLGQHQTPRHSRLSSSEDSPSVQSTGSAQALEEARPGGMKTVEIPYARLSTSTPFELLKTHLPEVPQESHYDLLTRLRVASALTTSLATRREILAVRILAIVNLAYVHPEVVFQQKVLQQDSDEPRRLQLAYQLAELVHPPGDRDAGIPRWLQTLALGGLEALAKHKTKAPDVCSALSVNVTHGVLLYVVRKAVAEMRVEHNDAESLDEDEWREALFSLLSFLPSTARTGEALVSAGLIPILVEVLTIRTSKAERNHPKVLNVLDTFVYNVRDAFQSLANSKGLDAISDLVAFEVDSAFTEARNGGGIPVEYRNQATDYDIPYFQQQTLRALFKFMHHMMGHSGGNFDRLLRNLIDSSQLLGGLRIVLKNAEVFGANVWSGAVNILSSFIHNEPTSYAVIAEAGLSKGLLEAVTCKDIIIPEEDKKEPGEGTRDESEHGPSAVVEEAVDSGDAGSSEPHLTPDKTADKTEPGEKVIIPRDRPLARGILPASDTISCIPQAFGAICLNSAGMKLFQASDALESFFEVFESPEHVRCMDSETDLPGILGSSFDELVRHHPQLKSSVLDSVFAMVVRVGCFVRSRASEKGVGTKLWVEGEDGKLHVSGGWGALAEKQNDMAPMTENSRDAEREPAVIRDEGGDIEMNDADTTVVPCHSGGAASPGRAATYEDVVEMEDEKGVPSVSVYLEVVAKFLGGFFSNTSLCCAFIDMGGVEYILDFCMLHSLPFDFSNRPASQAIARVVHALVEQKPHLVIPSLLHRTQTAVDLLKPFVNHEEKAAYFAPLTNRENSNFPEVEGSSLLAAEDVKENGTVYAKNLVVVLNLCHVLAESFSQPMFNHRSTNTIFTQVNLTDMYQRLVEDLGKLHRSCVWEEIVMETSLPELWNGATRLEGYGLGSSEADNIMGLVNVDGEAQASADAPSGTSEIEPIAESSVRAAPANGASMTKAEDKAAAIKRDEATAQFKNVRTLRYLLSQVPSSITNFFQGLARALVAKRAPESYQKQNAFAVADALGGNLLQQLVWRREMAPSTTEQYPYWIVMLTSLSQLLVEGLFHIPVGIKIHANYLPRPYRTTSPPDTHVGAASV